MVAEIVTKCEAFCKTMNASAKTLFKDYETADNVTVIKNDSKDKDPKKTYKAATVTFKISTNKIDKIRTGAEQAGPIATNHSWTCKSGHMADKARHVVPYINGKRVDDPYKSFKPVIEDYKKKWVAAMGSGLVNHKGKKAYSSDQYHLELKDAKTGIPQKEIDACYATYVDLTKDQHPKKNSDFEKSFKALLDGIRKKKGIPTEEEWQKEQDRKALLEKLKKMKFSGSATAHAQLFKKTNKNGKATLKTTKSILPDSKVIPDAGPEILIPMPLVGIVKSKTYADVTITVVLQLFFIQYPHLTQMFLKSAEMMCAVQLKGLMSFGADFSAVGDIDINLGSSMTEPRGKVIVEYTVDGLRSDDHRGGIEFDIKGTKSKLLKAT